jgi:hypothetical protein
VVASGPARPLASPSVAVVTNPIGDATIGWLARPIATPIIGIDVGEDFLDLAILDGAARTLRLARVAVAGIESGADRDGVAPDGFALAGIVNDAVAIRELQRRLQAAAPELDARGAIVLIDSPRSPRDLELSMHPAVADVRHGAARTSSSRAIDTVLRAFVRELALKRRDSAPYRLALFPTPELEFFAACARDPRCKPHLAAIERELFGSPISHEVSAQALAVTPALAGSPVMPAPVGGQIFTRFMLAGFAVYCALERTRSWCFEAYPDLAFRLWAGGEEILPKGGGRAALDVRKRITGRLADELGCAGARDLSTLDQADAAVLALSVGLADRVGAIAIIEHPAEGRFALALDREQARLDGAYKVT